MTSDPGLWRVLPMLAACLVAESVRAAARAASLREAMEEAVGALSADLFGEHPAGRGVSVQGPGHLIVTFPGIAPPTDAECVLVRLPSAASGAFAQTVGASQIAEVKGETARAVVVWSEGSLRPGPERGGRAEARRVQ